jgi:Major tropism determinant N-terminal domain
MSTQIQFRRGSSAQTAITTGVIGEIFVDTQSNTISVQDGITSGGTYLAKQQDMILGFNTISSNVANLSLFANAAYSEANTAQIVAQASFDSSNAAYLQINGIINQISGIAYANTAALAINANIYANAALNIANSTLSFANSILTYANNASNTANLTLTYLNSNVSYISGVNDAQNNAIVLTTNYAQAAFNQANSVPVCQEFVTVINLTQAAYDAVNSASLYANSIYGGSF